MKLFRKRDQEADLSERLFDLQKRINAFRIEAANGGYEDELFTNREYQILTFTFDVELHKLELLRKKRELDHLLKGAK